MHGSICHELLSDVKAPLDQTTPPPKHQPLLKRRVTSIQAFK